MENVCEIEAQKNISIRTGILNFPANFSMKFSSENFYCEILFRKNNGANSYSFLGNKRVAHARSESVTLQRRKPGCARGMQPAGLLPLLMVLLLAKWENTSCSVLINRAFIAKISIGLYKRDHERTTEGQRLHRILGVRLNHLFHPFPLQAQGSTAPNLLPRRFSLNCKKTISLSSRFQILQALQICELVSNNFRPLRPLLVGVQKLQNHPGTHHSLKGDPASSFC